MNGISAEEVACDDAECNPGVECQRAAAAMNRRLRLAYSLRGLDVLSECNDTCVTSACGATVVGACRGSCSCCGPCVAGVERHERRPVVR